MKISRGRPKMDAKETISYRMPLALTPEMMDAVARYAEDSKNWSFGVGKASIMRSLILFALEQKGYWPPASSAPSNRSLSDPMMPSSATAIDAKLDELAQRYERNGHSPERREEMLKKDREWLEKNGIPA